MGARASRDNWLGSPLIVDDQNLADENSMGLTVRNFIVDGSWDDDSLFAMLPLDSALKIILAFFYKENR
ncbi:hypothetical protein COLO4_27424 [Corchorus olitorius]|uniref:Uncharacterized protein n=1 Tax=Corchorus olitorius TaxID=93759 RepID=A0A1R3HR61_9ROSI|nr:hypothetical protein COLO4_27424 [Corchorus olitorius]